jgi:hypothetical protein
MMFYEWRFTGILERIGCLDCVYGETRAFLNLEFIFTTNPAQPARGFGWFLMALKWCFVGVSAGLHDKASRTGTA